MASIFPDEYRAIIQALIRARKDAGVTQVQLAALIGQRQTFVSKFETGERRLDVAEFVLISKALGVDPMGLINGSRVAVGERGR